MKRIRGFFVLLMVVLIYIVLLTVSASAADIIESEAGDVDLIQLYNADIVENNPGVEENNAAEVELFSDRVSYDNDRYSTINDENGITISTEQQTYVFDSIDSAKVGVEITLPEDSSITYIGWVAVLDNSSWSWVQLASWYIPDGGGSYMLNFAAVDITTNQELTFALAVFSSDNFVTGQALCGHTFFVTINQEDEAEDNTCGDGLTWELNDDTLTISGTGSMTSWSYINPAPWDSQRESICSVIIEPGVSSIGDYAFYYCLNVEEVSIPESVTTIGSYAFRGCKSLQAIELSDSVGTIGDYAFSNCSSLPKIKLPDSIKNIGNGLFSGCGALVDIGFSEELESIGKYAFAYCSSIKTMTIPDSTQSIGAYAFYSCESMTTVNLPGALSGSENPQFCIIDRDAFAICSSLESITIPKSVTEIGDHAFLRCGSLSRITIPDHVTSIGVAAFSQCSSLTGIDVSAENTSYCDVDGVLFTIDKTTLVCYPAGKTERSYNIPNTVTAIEEQAFAGCTAISYVELSDSVTIVGSGAFILCASLKSVTIPDNVTSIGGSAFKDCTSLISVTILGDETDLDIGDYVFYNCKSLASVTIPERVTGIGTNAFHYCRDMDVFYDGTEEDWATLSADSGVGEAALFSLEDYDDDMLVTITTEDVAGGILVTMASSGNSIYYTLDGSSPCTYSIPYAGSFLLDEADEYFVNAIAFNLDKGTYGDVTTEYVPLEQSSQPEIYEENGRIVITAERNEWVEGSVYYTLDMTEEPTTKSYRYDNPLTFTETTVIKARTIEVGYAPSETVNYTYYVAGEGISYPADSYSFKNSANSFSYGLGYAIPETRYEEVFGNIKGQLLYDTYGLNEDKKTVPWGGSCFGMSATALLFNSGLLSLSQYSDEASNLNELPAPKSRTNALTLLIEQYQIAQFLPVVMEERDDESTGGTMAISGQTQGVQVDNLISAISNACTGGEPVILILWKEGLSGSHAVVPYKLENGKIYIYDCNNPGTEENPVENVITYSIGNNGILSFQYGEYGEYSYAMSYNRLSTLTEALGIETGRASLSSDGTELMLLSINTSKFVILDASGNKVTNYVSCRATEDMETDRTLLYLPVGTYTIRNEDTSLGSLSISVATENEYYTVNIGDPTATLEMGVENGHLYFTVTSDNATEVTFTTSNSAGWENEITAATDYIKIYAYTETAILIDAKASTAVINGMDTKLISDETDTTMYHGVAAKRLAYTAKSGLDNNTDYSLSTDRTELPEGTFVLAVYVDGVDDSGTLYAASYDDNGQMIALKSAKTQTGQRKYVFTITEEATELGIYLLSANQFIPLTENLRLQ